MIKIGRVLRLIRESKGINGQQFAGAIGVTRQYVNAIELDKKKVSLHNLVKASEALGCSVPFLLYFTTNGTYKKDLSDDDKSLIDSIDNLESAEMQLKGAVICLCKEQNRRSAPCRGREQVT